MIRRLGPVVSTGLTTAVTVYTSGDVLGQPMVFANAADAIGGRGYIRGAFLSDNARVIGAVDAFIFRDTVAALVDNSISNLSFADQQKCVGVVSLTALDVGSVSSGVGVPGCTIPYDCLATSLSVVLVTRTANSFFTAVGDLALTLLIDTAYGLTV